MNQNGAQSNRPLLHKFLSPVL
uniref:Uncharacterized protein n=1 Tax=Anguilla anguilla TaxID=7936 RepID=A0A0E9QMV2_ANGAN